MSICLFQNKEFISAAGIPRKWKVEGDALYHPGNWEWAAARVAEACTFTRVLSVPSGGDKFAQACYQHVTLPYGSGDTLVVEDVWTTGGSTIRFLEKNGLWEIDKPKPGVHVWAMFANFPVAEWANVLWTYTGPNP